MSFEIKFHAGARFRNDFRYSFQPEFDLYQFSKATSTTTRVSLILSSNEGQDPKTLRRKSYRISLAEF